MLNTHECLNDDQHVDEILSLIPADACLGVLKECHPPLEIDRPRQAFLIQAILDNWDYLHALAERELGPHLRAGADATDLVQETCLEAFRDLRSFNGSSTAALRSWIRRILINNVVGLGRQYRRGANCEFFSELPPGQPAVSSCSGFDEGEGPGWQAIRSERVQKIRQALDRLSERERQSVLLRAFDDRTFREIGDQLGFSEVAARKIWLRVSERLRRELRDC